MGSSSENRTRYIYGLFCPVKEVFYYVGASVDPAKRFEQHCSEGRWGLAHKKFPHLYSASYGSSGPKSDWTAWIFLQDQEPELVILEVVEGGPERDGRAPWREAELRWTKRFMDERHPLTNYIGPATGFPLRDDKVLMHEAIERGREMFG